MSLKCFINYQPELHDEIIWQRQIKSRLWCHKVQL